MLLMLHVYLRLILLVYSLYVVLLLPIVTFQ